MGNINDPNETAVGLTVKILIQNQPVSYINKIQQESRVCRYLSTAKSLYMFWVSIAPIIRSTQNCNCSLWYRSQYLSNILRPMWPSTQNCSCSLWYKLQYLSNNLPALANGHIGGRLLLRYYDLYQRLQLQFCVLLMMDAMDTRNMQSDSAVNKCLHTVASCWILLIWSYDAGNREYKTAFKHWWLCQRSGGQSLTYHHRCPGSI